MKSGKAACSPSCSIDAWTLLVQFVFVHRGHLPTLAAELDLSPAQCHLLHLIEPGHSLPMRQLAATLACDASNITGLVDRLESRGLVRRRSSPDDRRVKVLDLTAAGLRLRTALLERIAAPPPILERLSASEQRQLVRILGRLLRKSET